MKNNTPTATQTIPEDILSTFTNWCKAADRSEAEVEQEINEISTNVINLTTANREQLMDAWRAN